MWRGLGQDPGGSTGPGPPNAQELDELKDQFEQQQLLIAQLKEMLRKNEQVNVTQEKVDALASTLTKMNARAKRSKKEGGKEGQNLSKKETPANEKIDKLRQQLEENKMKLAERDKSQRGIEEMVTQLKAQFDASQSLISQTPLNLSFVEVDVKDYSAEMTSQELYSILITKDKKLNDMVAKVQKLEASVLDLQENIKEKDSVIDARTKAITLMSENLSRKGKTTLDALDETKTQMRKMQENFVEMEQQMNIEIQQLKQEVADRDIEISHLNDRNNYLEHVRKELTSANVELQDKLDNQSELIETFQKGDSVIEKLQETIKSLEDENKKLHNFTNEDELLKLKQKISEFEDIIKEKDEQNQILQKQLENLKSPSYEMNLNPDEDEFAKLKKQLDESNKNMIKVKAQHKAKLKEMTKKIESFKKIGDHNAEIVKLTDENLKLSQKLAELEEEKGALQLKLMETSGGKDSIPLEAANELERQLTELSEILTYKDNQILTLSKSLDESNANLKCLEEKLEGLSHLENVQVKSEITSIHLEEQLDKLESEKNDLIETKRKLEEENGKLEETINGMKKENLEITTKLETYIQENIDLMDKLEKLSAEKVSSAESIEIVEGLTQQEKLELEAYQKNRIPNDNKSSAEHLAENLELNESVNQLTEETSELLQRIDLFTVERREVMEKMEQLANENNQLNNKIKEIENNRDVLVETYEQLQTEKEELDIQQNELQKQKGELEVVIETLKTENENLKKSLEGFQIENDENKIENKYEEKEESKFEVKDTKVEVKKESKKSKSRRRNQKSPSQTRDPQTSDKDDLKSINDKLKKEIEEYKMLIDIQKQEIQELKVQIMGQDYLSSEKLDLEAKMSSLEIEYKAILDENNSLKIKIKEDSEKVHEKDLIENELRAARMKIEEFEKKISENLDEINLYKTTLEENKNELISSSNQINELKNQLDAKEIELKNYIDEIEHLNSVVVDLNSAVRELEIENEKSSLYEEMTKQVDELKEVLKSNIDQINEYEDELNKNTQIIIELQGEIKTLNNKILETEHILESKNDELKNLEMLYEEKQTELGKLQEEIEIKNKNFHDSIEMLKNKCLTLQNQISSNTTSMEPFQDKIKELEDRNKDQLEKMKKIAANLKKKTLQYQELEQKYTEINQKYNDINEKYIEINEKWENEQKEKDNLREFEDLIQKENVNLKNQLNEKENQKRTLEIQIENFEKELWELQEKINFKESEFNKLNMEYNILKEESNDKINKMTQKLSQFEHQAQSIQVESYQKEASNTEEINKKDVLIQKLTQKAKSFKQQLQQLTKENENLKQLLEQQKGDFQINSNALQMKINELELFIETQDGELNRYKERVNRLEQGLYSVEERRVSLEKKAIELGAELQEKNDKYEELSQSEDMLERRIESLIKHDEAIEKKLQDAINENEMLNIAHKELINENSELHNSLKHLQEKFNEVTLNNENFNIMENEILHLKQIIANLENDKKHSEIKIISMKEDAEKNEMELQNQIEFYNNDHKILVEKCEILNDQIKELQDYQGILTSDVETYKNKLYEQQQHLDGNQEKNNVLELELNKKINLIEKLEEDNKIFEENIVKLSHQIDEINEINDNLKVIIEERNKQLELYQGENSQLVIENSQINGLNQELNLQLNHLSGNYNLLLSSYEELQGKYQNDKNEKDKTDVENEILLKNITPLSSSDTKHEEFISKIKSLEFMLFNSEKEKEDTLKQCEALSGELARLLYLQEKTENVQSIEDQIITSNEMAMSSKDISELKSIEFEPTKEINPESAIPVVEEEIQPKTAYLCYPEDTFGENDDGWGLSTEEAKLEQEHIQFSESDLFRNQIQTLEEKIRVLEQARERHSEEIRQSQQKSGKLMKKLKEFKVKNDELSAQLSKKSDGFDDLNSAIEDELKSQISNLEKKIKEISTELEKERNEKGNLLKRIDTLTAANERLVDTKEKQELELISYQNKTRELNSKLEQFEWGDDGFEKSPVHVSKVESSSVDESLKVQIAELTETIKDLTLDNEELQALLEEQRNLRISAEKAKSIEPISENMKTESEFLAIVDEKNKLNQQLDEFKLQLINVNKHIEELQSEIQKLNHEKSQLNELINQNNQIIQQLQNENQSFKNEISNDKDIISQLENRLEIIQNEYKNYKENLIKVNNEELLRKENEKLLNDLNQINIENQSIKDEINKNHDTISQLNNRLEILQNEYDALKNQKKSDFEINSLKEENSKLIENLNDLIVKNENLNSLLQQKEIEFENKLVLTSQQLIEEWMQKVDQRGYDIAESWKLHVEERENEFYRTEQMLRKQITELEEKHNILVNENNELRKNVDAEIRNEVDRVSNLQTQINEKQFLINELTIELEKQKEEINRYHLTINELNQILVDKDKKIEEASFESIKLKNDLEAKESQYKDLEQIVKFKENDLELKQKMLEEYEINLLGNKKIIEETENIIKENQKIIQENNQIIQDKDNLIQEKINTIQEKDYMIQEKDNMIQEKDNLIQEKMNIIEQKENQIKSIQIDNLDQKTNELETTKYQLIQNETIINQLKDQLNQTQINFETLIKEKVDTINELKIKEEKYVTEIAQKNERITTLEQQFYDLQRQFGDLQQQLATATMHLQQYYQQIEILNNEVQKYSTMNEEFILKDNEITKLNALLNEKEREYQQIITDKNQQNTAFVQELTSENDSLKRRLANLETHYDEILSSKDMDMESYKLQLQEQISRNNQLVKEQEENYKIQTELALKSAEYDDIKIKFDEQNLLLEEEQKQLDELRKIIEEQVLKIQDLQKQLYEKSQNYDALIAEVDLTHKISPESSKSQIEKSQIESSQIEMKRDSEDMSEPVSRAELDLALYMLHQRDVRCEELTDELMRLLEERDTLQLKLSNALREREQLRCQFDHEESTSSVVDSPQREAKFHMENENPLNTKLSELKTLSYSKDKSVIDEKERRRMQQFSIMQQHRDEASKLPPEAAARLLDASYTLSRDVQSPSKVLLNWLWGRSTPKVDDI